MPTIYKLWNNSVGSESVGKGRRAKKESSLKTHDSIQA